MLGSVGFLTACCCAGSLLPPSSSLPTAFIAVGGEWEWCVVWSALFLWALLYCRVQRLLLLFSAVVCRNETVFQKIVSQSDLFELLAIFFIVISSCGGS